MLIRRVASLLIFLLMLVTSCFAHHMSVIVNKDNKIGNIAAVELAKLFRSETKKWPDGKAVVLVLHKNSLGESETLERLNKLSDAEWKALIAAHKDSIQMVDSDADVLKVVQSTPGAVGLVNVSAIDGSITVIRVGKKLPMETGYLPH